MLKRCIHALHDPLRPRPRSVDAGAPGDVNYFNDDDATSNEGERQQIPNSLADIRRAGWAVTPWYHGAVVSILWEFGCQG